MKYFTDTYIKGLKPERARYEKYQGGGFGIRVSPAGLKTWIYRYKVADRTDKITFGHYPAMSLAQANHRFLELSSQRKQGHIPKQCIKAEKQALEQQRNNTVKKFIVDWYESSVTKKWKRPELIRKQIEKDIIPLLGNIELDKLQTSDISQALDLVVARGAPIHANRVLSSLKIAFNYGMSRGVITQNPAIGIRAKDIGGTEKPRERVLSIFEIRTLWQFLDGKETNLSLQIKHAIKLILLLGVRTAELRLAEWDEFDIERALWTVPADHVKSKMVMKIHLSPLALSLLQELKAATNSKYVLSGVDENKTLTENALPRAIKRIEERVGIPSWTAHDLRRTFATQLSEVLHVDVVVIEKCLGHKMPKIMATYNKNEMLPQRKDALNQWAQYVENLLQKM